MMMMCEFVIDILRFLIKNYNNNNKTNNGKLESIN